ncbi:hypothetical protein ZWY2020_025603 [Hordeum vulgare]|nr:hypothetical protein ZWY2020_025603 [Hordeum vulgare]
MVDTVAPETHSRIVLSSFKVSAWMANPEAIPAVRCSCASRDVLIRSSSHASQYKVLIHLDEVRDFFNVGEPWFLGSSSSSGQSGILDAGDRPGGGGGVSVTRRSW